MDVTASGHAAALWTSLHLVLLLVLSVLVVRPRRRHRVTVGHADIPELTQAVRAFGNATEYVPAGLAAIAVMAVVNVSPLAIHMVGLTLFLGRLSHAVGLSRSTGATLPRAIGVVATWLAYVGAAVALMFYAIT